MDAVIADCDIVLDETYHVKAMQQSMMETFRTCTYLDTYGPSDRAQFHADPVPCAENRCKMHSIFPRQSACHQTAYRWRFRCKTDGCHGSISGDRNMEDRKTCKMIYTREESMIASSPRHEMEVRVRLGAMSDGTIRYHRPAHTFKYRGVW